MGCGHGQRARQEARALESGGADGIIVENFGDVPYGTAPASAHTVASMTVAVETVLRMVGVPVGINVLRNDPCSALAIAAVTGARFVRANVHFGVMVADEGLIEGNAHETLRYRRDLGAEHVAIFADVPVKHARPLGSDDIGRVAVETVQRGLADALIVSGPATGVPTELEDVARVKASVPEVGVLIGSGVTEDNAAELLKEADGAIVGTSLKVDRNVHNPVDLERVKRLASKIKSTS